MAETPPTIDLEPLLAPFTEGPAVGRDPREDFTPQSAYYRLRDARAAAREGERKLDTPDSDARAVQAADAQVAQGWRTVRELAPAVLAKSAKDLEVAAWYAEALVRGDGLPGLAAGALLLHGLVEAYWGELFPRPDDDGLVTVVAPVTGLNGEGRDGSLLQPLQKLTLFRRRDGTPFPFFQYDQSAALIKLPEAARKKRIEAGAVPFDDVEREARADAQHMAALRRDGRAALQAWIAMSAAFEARAGADSPPSSRVREMLEKIVATAELYAPPEAAAPEPLPDDTLAAPGPASGADGQARAPAAAVTREDMLRELNRIAEYFRRTEPQSPLADTLAEAVRRARMTWPELLEEVIAEAPARAAILSKLGIKPPE